MTFKNACSSCNEWVDWNCLDGEAYGFCESEYCGGGCEMEGPCSCICHAEPWEQQQYRLRAELAEARHA